MHHQVFRECLWSYRDMMSPSSTDQGRKCNWPMPLAVAQRQPHRKSNWICDDYIAFTKPWIEKLKDSRQRDPILATVYQLTQQGWPHQRRQVPRLARRYWDFRDKLSTDDGMLLKGPRLIIPGELQEEYLSHLHEGHLSESKVQENAKQHMYWTGIDVDIDDYTKRSQKCIKRSQVPKEPLQAHDIREGPWRKLGIDYFAFDGNSYVLICEISLSLQSQNIILVIKGPSNRSLFN